MTSSSPPPSPAPAPSPDRDADLVLLGEWLHRRLLQGALDAFSVEADVNEWCRSRERDIEFHLLAEDDEVIAEGIHLGDVDPQLAGAWRDLVDAHERFAAQLNRARAELGPDTEAEGASTVTTEH